MIEWRWDCDQFTGLISSFFTSLVKIRRSLSHFGIFIANKVEGVSQLSLIILPRKKIEQSNLQMCTYKALLCYAYTIMFFWCLLTFLKCFLSHAWEVINCTAWVKPVMWNHSETVWNFIKTLWRKTVETQETHGVVSTSIRCLCDVAWLKLMRVLMVIY